MSQETSTTHQLGQPDMASAHSEAAARAAEGSGGPEYTILPVPPRLRRLDAPAWDELRRRNEGETTDRGIRKGDLIKKTAGEYIFRGVVLSRFQTLDGSSRIAAQNQDGIIHIFRPDQVERVRDE